MMKVIDLANDETKHNRILVYGINYHPEQIGVGKYTTGLAEHLALGEDKVTVITSYPYYPSWSIDPVYNKWWYKIENINDVRVIRCPLYVPHKPLGLKRIVHLMSFAITSLPIVLMQKAWKPDLVFVVEPTVFCLPNAVILKCFSKARLWLHIQDFELRAAFGLDILSSRWLMNFALKIQNYLRSKVDIISTISHTMLDSLKDDNTAPDKLVYFPNWVDFEQIKFDSKAGKDFRKEVGIPDNRYLVLYSGNLGNKQGLENLIIAARLVTENSRIFFLVCGNGSSRAKLEDLAKQEDLSNIKFIDLQSVDRLSAMLSAADLHLVIQKGSASDLVLPSKLTNILAIGGNVVVTAFPKTELGKLFREHPNLGSLCKPDCAESLAAEINRWASIDKQKPSHAASHFAEQTMSKTMVLSNFKSDIDSLLSQNT